MIEVRLLPKEVQKSEILRILKEHGRTYRINPPDEQDRESITCYTCGNTSWSKGDVKHLFCLICGFHRDTARNLFIPYNNPYAG